MLEKKLVKFLLCLVVVLIFSATGVKAENILFIAAMEDTFMPGDDALKAYIEGLGHTVTYFDDDENEADTEIAAAAADLVIISESVSSGDIRTEITEIETPKPLKKPSPSMGRGEKKKQKRPAHKFHSSEVGGRGHECAGEKTRINRESRVPGSLLHVVV